MKLIEQFQRLTRPKKVLTVLIASPALVAIALLALGVSSWLVAIFALPIIGFAVSRNSWSAGKRSSDKKIHALFIASLISTVVLLFLLRQPQFRTDWEGGNALDDLIMLLWLATASALATTWFFAGWVGHRVLVRSRK